MMSPHVWIEYGQIDVVLVLFSSTTDPAAVEKPFGNLKRATPTNAVESLQGLKNPGEKL